MSIIKHITRNNQSVLTVWIKMVNPIIRITLIFIILITCNINIIAQIGIQTNNPDASSVLDIVSSDKGLLIPRVNLTSNLTSPSPVTSPATGLLIYNSGISQEQGFYFWAGSTWKMLKSQEAGDIQGAASSTDNAIVRFDGTSGNIIQNSSVIIDDNSNITGVNNITTAGFTMSTNAGTDKVLVSDAMGNGNWDEALPLDIEEDNVVVASGINTLNFQGAVTVIDEGNNKATITVTESTSVEEIIQLSSSRSTDVNNLITPALLVWNIELFKDPLFRHSLFFYPSRIKVLQDGLYEINYMFSIENTTNKRKTIRARLRKNGTTYIDGSESYSFSYSNTDDKATHVSSSFIVELNNNDYLEVLVNGQTNDGAVLLIPNENLIFVRILRSW